MSRQIKFRVWDENYKKWVTEDYVLFPDGKPAWGTWEYGFFKIDSDFINEKGLVVEQFTGLKDKDGKDIYEGDIVQFHGNSDDLAIVKFGEFGVPEIDTEEYVDVAIGFYYEPKGSLSNIAPFNMTVPLNKSYANLGEIIGNIHENPELVEADDRFD
jgi:uncharacterized phage protein (TIGR01671 family)